MRINERMKRALSILLCVMMLVQYVPLPAFAATTDNLCEHHPVHTAECGYVEAAEGSPCTHIHDEACGYAEPIGEVLCACTETDDTGALVHTEGCGYVAPVAGSPCTHVHDASCGYIEAVEGQPCGYECGECAAAAEAYSDLGIGYICVAGNGDSGLGNWVYGEIWNTGAESNIMTEVTANVYEITYTDLPASDNYELIFAADGDWEITWGEMDFTYTDESGWNTPDTAWVQVENTGNTAVTVTYDYVTERTDITGSFFDGTATVTAPVAINTESTKKIWLRLDGTPSEALNNTTIGSVKLTIE